MLRRAGTDETDEEMIHEELSGKITGPEWMCLCHVERSRDISQISDAWRVITTSGVVLTGYMTDKSRDLIRSLPVRSAFGLSVHVAASRAAPFSTALRYARNDKTPDWNGNAYCAREKLANRRRLISSLSLIRAIRLIRGSFETLKIVASLAPKKRSSRRSELHEFLR